MKIALLNGAVGSYPSETLRDPQEILEQIADLSGVAGDSPGKVTLIALKGDSLVFCHFTRALEEACVQLAKDFERCCGESHTQHAIVWPLTHCLALKEGGVCTAQEYRETYHKVVGKLPKPVAQVAQGFFYLGDQDIFDPPILRLSIAISSALENEPFDGMLNHWRQILSTLAQQKVNERDPCYFEDAA